MERVCPLVILDRENSFNNLKLNFLDCVMLSGETAKGDYPIECLRMMHAVILILQHTLYKFIPEIISIGGMDMGIHPKPIPQIPKKVGFIPNLGKIRFFWVFWVTN